MPNYKRLRVPGGTYFFTAVSAARRPVLTTAIGRSCLRQSLEAVRLELPFEVVAIVLLPDHFHCNWKLPVGGDDFSTRWKAIKGAFTVQYLARGGVEAPVSASRRKKRERGVWQRRFWEHCIRNDDDLKRCADYIHYNPVKRGYVARVRDWRWSSFYRFVSMGEYELDWGVGVRIERNRELFGDEEFA